MTVSNFLFSKAPLCFQARTQHYTNRKIPSWHPSIKVQLSHRLKHHLVPLKILTLTSVLTVSLGKVGILISALQTEKQENLHCLPQKSNREEITCLKVTEAWRQDWNELWILLVKASTTRRKWAFGKGGSLPFVFDSVFHSHFKQKIPHFPAFWCHRRANTMGAAPPAAARTLMECILS